MRSLLPTFSRLRSMGLNPATLSFPRKVEEEFAEVYFVKSLPQVRLAIILGAALYSAFGLLDIFLIPEMKAVFWTLRFAVALPALIAAFIFSYLPGFKRAQQPVMAGLMVLGGSIIIAMIVMAPPPISFSYYAGLILIFIWGYTFIRLRFIWATSAAWLLVLCYEVAAISQGTPLPILVNNNFFFISANFIGMFACYSIEYFLRRDYYMVRLLEEEKEKVKDANRHLEEKVHERTVRLKLKNEDLEREMAERARMEEEKRQLEEKLVRSEKMEAIGRLAGGVAHDLNNVLTAVVAYPDLVLMMLPDDSPSRKHLMTIQRSGLKAAAIVRDLLTLARRGVIVKDVVDMNRIVTEYLGSPECSRLKLFHPRATFRQDLQEGLWNIEGSPIHLMKTVMNLFSNAAEAMPQGGEVSIRTANRTLSGGREGHESSMKEGEYVLVEIADQGIGISKDDLKKIFEPFYTKKVMGRSGTGLGMAVVWGTVDDHAGSIDVQSELGKGTTVTVSFPRSLRTVSEEEAGVSDQDLEGSGEKILVVDDIKDQREMARQLLEKLGYSVETVDSGERAVEYIRENDADLILLDMIMDPGIDGYDTYRRVLEVRPGTRAIIASGFSETERVREAIKLGVGEYIMKPYTLKKIGAAVKAELGRSRAPS
jgi:signal transduction histidine kinase/ActR/RegA family two-component response regulator